MNADGMFVAAGVKGEVGDATEGARGDWVLWGWDCAKRERRVLRWESGAGLGASVDGEGRSVAGGGGGAGSPRLRIRGWKSAFGAMVEGLGPWRGAGAGFDAEVGRCRIVTEAWAAGPDGLPRETGRDAGRAVVDASVFDDAGRERILTGGCADLISSLTCIAGLARARLAFDATGVLPRVGKLLSSMSGTGAVGLRSSTFILGSVRVIMLIADARRGAAGGAVGRGAA